MKGKCLIQNSGSKKPFLLYCFEWSFGVARFGGASGRFSTWGRGNSDFLASLVQICRATKPNVSTFVKYMTVTNVNNVSTPRGR